MARPTLVRVHRPGTPLVVALALLVGLVLAGRGDSWQPGVPGDTVRAVPSNGPLGLGSNTPTDERLAGAHPATSVTPTLQVQAAVARNRDDQGPDVSDTAVPARVLAAYRSAARTLARTDPGCNLTWPLLAGVGKVESGHASGGNVDRAGLTRSPILGPVLDGGPGMAAIRDTDAGRWDTDSDWDRAVGPMQFIPSSWQVHGADGNGDGRRDPNNIADAALASGGYLCTGDRDLETRRDRRMAVFSYNHSWDYVDLVLAWAEAYAGGTPVFPGDLTLVAGDGKGGGKGSQVTRRKGDLTVALEPAPEGAARKPRPAASASASPAPAEPAPSDGAAASVGPAPAPAQPPTPAPSQSAPAAASRPAADEPSPVPSCPDPSPSPETPEPTESGAAPVDPTSLPTPTGTESPDPSASPSPSPEGDCGADRGN